MFDYTKLINAASAAGMTPEEIAEKFGIDVEQVRRTLGQDSPPSEPARRRRPRGRRGEDPSASPAEEPASPEDDADGSPDTLMSRIAGKLKAGARQLGRSAASSAMLHVDREFGVLGRVVTDSIRRRTGIERGDMGRRATAALIVKGTVGAIGTLSKKVEDSLKRVENGVRDVTKDILERVESVETVQRDRDRTRREDQAETRQRERASPGSERTRTSPVGSTVSAAAGGLAGLVGGVAATSLLSPSQAQAGDADKPLPWEGAPDSTAPGAESADVGPRSERSEGDGQDLKFSADEITFDADRIIFTKPIGGPTGWGGSMGGDEGGQQLGGPTGYGGTEPRQTPSGDTLPGPDPSVKRSRPTERDAREAKERVGSGSAPADGEGSYSGEPQSAADAMLRSIMSAETGSEGAVLDERRFVRTRVTPEQNGGRHSSAYGPVQMTRDYLTDFRKRNGKDLPQEEREYLDRLIDQGDQMLKTSRSGYYDDPTYGFGGSGTEGKTLRDRQLYGQVAQRSLVDLARRSGSYQEFIKSFRGADDRGYFNKAAAAAAKHGKTPEELFKDLQGMSVGDVPELKPQDLEAVPTGKVESQPLGDGHPGGYRTDPAPEPEVARDPSEKTGRVPGPPPMDPGRMGDRLGPKDFDLGRFSGPDTQVGTRLREMTIEKAMSDSKPTVVQAPVADKEPAAPPESSIKRDELDTEPPATSVKDHFEEGFPGLGKRSSHSGLGM